MKWSKAELENPALGGADATVERVMKHLSDPENADIFSAENFSYLWGALGVAGICGADDVARSKIWWALKENGVADAYDKGVLGDYTRMLAASFKDSRLRAWAQLDNFQTGVKFRNTVLQKLADSGTLSKEEILTYCFDYKKLDERLDKKELDSSLKTYLEQLRSQGDGGSISAVYDKTAILRKLCDTIAYTRRKLTESEKDYLFRYLREMAEGGFAPENIGLTDKVLARLMADNDVLEGKSELEAAPFLARNAEIEEFAVGLEKIFGFFEETAAKFIRGDPAGASGLTQRCLELAQKDERPKGVVFALALLDLNQVKSAVKLLSQLADKGCATEMAGFLHRLLPKTTGAESLILDIIENNFRHLPEENPVLREYAARRFLFSVRDFAEAGSIRQAADLLIYLAEEGKFSDNKEMAQVFAARANMLIGMDKSLAPEMEKLAAKFRLSVYKTDSGTFIGTDEDNPLTIARKHFEKAVKKATTLDLSAATDRIKGLETATYGVYRNLKNTLSGNKEAPQNTEPAEAELPHGGDSFVATGNNVAENEKNSEDVAKAMPETDTAPAAETEKTFYAPAEEESRAAGNDERREDNATKKININNILKINSKEVDEYFEKIKKIASATAGAAAERAEQINEKIKSTGLSQKTSGGRIREIVRKFNFFRKKS